MLLRREIHHCSDYPPRIILLLLSRHFKFTGLAQFDISDSDSAVYGPSSNPPQLMWAADSRCSEAENVSVLSRLGLATLSPSSLLRERSYPPSFPIGERSLPSSSFHGEKTYPSWSLFMKCGSCLEPMPRKISNIVTDLSSCVTVFTGPEEATRLVSTTRGGGDWFSTS